MITSSFDENIVGEIGGSRSVPCPHPDGVFSFWLESRYHGLVVFHVFDSTNPEDPTDIHSIVDLEMNQITL
jgi:hypothetical protein